MCVGAALLWVRLGVGGLTGRGRQHVHSFVRSFVSVATVTLLANFNNGGRAANTSEREAGMRGKGGSQTVSMQSSERTNERTKERTPQKVSRTKENFRKSEQRDRSFVRDLLYCWEFALLASRLNSLSYLDCRPCRIPLFVELLYLAS